MGLELTEGIILYQGREVGQLEYDVEQRRGRITLAVEFHCEAGDHVVPLVAFSRALTSLELPQSEVLLSITTGPDDIAYSERGPRLLVEEVVKVRPNVWNFHKTDKDRWPSLLHGHDYEKNLKLDAITGEIYDVTTRKEVGTLNGKKLAQVQGRLRQSKDFTDLVAQLIDNAAGHD